MISKTGSRSRANNAYELFGFAIEENILIAVLQQQVWSY
jgi:hypothetical protein